MFINVIVWRREERLRKEERHHYTKTLRTVAASKMEDKIFLGDERAKERRCIVKPPTRMQPHQYSDLSLLRQILGF